MFESVTQPGTHIGVPPTDLITSGTEEEQRIDASLFRVYHKNVTVCHFILINRIQI